MNHPSVSAAPRQAAVFFILVTVVLDMLSFGIIIPVLPRLVEEFLGGDTAQAAEIYGLMGTAWALMQFVCSPIQGALSDHFGRRPVVLLSNLGLGLDFILMALAPNLAWLFAGRVISGIASSSFSTAGAYIADVTATGETSRSIRHDGSGLRVGICLGARGGWALGRHRSALALLGRGSDQFAQCLLRIFRACRNRSRPTSEPPSAGDEPTRSGRLCCCAHTMNCSDSRRPTF